MRVDGRLLHELREQRGLRQIDLANKASISKSYLSMLERGVRRTASAAVVSRLAGVLGVAMRDLQPTTPRLRPKT